MLIFPFRTSNYLIVRGKLKLAYGPTGPFLWAFWSPPHMGLLVPHRPFGHHPNSPLNSEGAIPRRVTTPCTVQHAQLDGPNRRLSAV